MYSVLYLDDEPDLLELGKLFMEDSGPFSVTTAGSSKEAYQILKNQAFDAIISDFQMPECDGIQFLKYLRASTDIPFILFTGRGREEVVIEAINSGVDFYVQKGGEPAAQFAELGHKVIQAISRRRAEAAVSRHSELLRQTAVTSMKFIRLSGDQIDEAITRTLGEIGDFTGADRCYITQVIPGEEYAEVTHEWTRDGIRPTKEILGRIPYLETPWLLERLRKFEQIIFPSTADLPEGPAEALRQRTRLTGETIRSVIVIPLTFGNRNFGILGLDAITREISWNEEDISVLKIFAQVITNALARKEADNRIKESEELYRTIFESTGTAMVILNDDMTVIGVNREMVRISGYTKDEIVGQIPWTRFISPDDVEQMKQFHIRRRTDPTEAPGEYEFHGITRSGSIVNTIITVKMIPGTRKSVASVIDTTPLKAAQAALVESEEMFRTLAESLAVGIYMIQDRKIVYVNPAFAGLFGYTPEYLVHEGTLKKLILEEDHELIKTAITDRLSGNHGSRRYTIRGIHRDGSIKHLEIFGSKTRYRGKPAIIGTMMEIIGKTTGTGT